MEHVGFSVGLTEEAALMGFVSATEKQQRLNAAITGDHEMRGNMTMREAEELREFVDAVLGDRA